MVFKSIDSLFDKEKNKLKRSIIYNESTSKGRMLSDIMNGGRGKDGTPAGYDYKALSYDRSTSDAVFRNKMGANSSAELHWILSLKSSKRTVLYSSSIATKERGQL